MKNIEFLRHSFVGCKGPDDLIRVNTGDGRYFLSMKNLADILPYAVKKIFENLDKEEMAEAIAVLAKAIKEESGK